MLVAVFLIFLLVSGSILSVVITIIYGNSFEVKCYLEDGEDECLPNN